MRQCSKRTVWNFAELVKVTKYRFKKFKKSQAEFKKKKNWQTHQSEIKEHQGQKRRHWKQSEGKKRYT